MPVVQYACLLSKIHLFLVCILVCVVRRNNIPLFDGAYETSLCSDSSLRCQGGAARICCWARLEPVRRAGSRSYPSIFSCSHGSQQQSSRPLLLLLSIDGTDTRTHGLTDGRTDTRPLNRRCYTGSVNRYRIQTRKTVSWVASKQTRHACLTASEVEKRHWWWKTVSLHHFIVGGDSNKWLLPVIFVCIFAN